MIERNVGKDTFLDADPEEPLCDFCSEAHPPHRFKARDVKLQGQDEKGRDLWSKGDWAACDTCALLINTNNRVGLQVRAFKSLAPQEQTIQAGEIIKQIHDKFFKARIP